MIEGAVRRQTTLRRDNPPLLDLLQVWSMVMIPKDATAAQMSIAEFILSCFGALERVILVEPVEPSLRGFAPWFCLGCGKLECTLPRYQTNQSLLK